MTQGPEVKAFTRGSLFNKLEQINQGTGVDMPKQFEEITRRLELSRKHLESVSQAPLKTSFAVQAKSDWKFHELVISNNLIDLKNACDALKHYREKNASELDPKKISTHLLKKPVYVEVRKQSLHKNNLSLYESVLRAAETLHNSLVNAVKYAENISPNDLLRQQILNQATDELTRALTVAEKQFAVNEGYILSGWRAKQSPRFVKVTPVRNWSCLCCFFPRPSEERSDFSDEQASLLTVKKH